ncbi:MAG: recombination mediator RecR [Bacteroidales bacterium]|nr:recombination mediator RecR [Bacteroidales bacterium]
MEQGLKDDAILGSPLLDRAVNELASLPGLGRRTALRLALWMLRRPEGVAVALGQSLIDLRKGVRYCRTCRNVAESDECAICADSRRDHSTVCVVESVGDVMAMERTGVYRGVYHVLGGVISAMDGVGPSDLEVDSLVDRVARGGIKEVILALSATMDGETTSYYVYRRLRDSGVKVSQLARGMAVGSDLALVDEVTLGRSLQARITYSV